MARFALHPFSLGHRLPKDNVELIPIVSEGNPGEFGVGFFGVTPALFVLVRFFLCWRKRKSGREICVSSLLSGLCLWFFLYRFTSFFEAKVFHTFCTLFDRFSHCQDVSGTVQALSHHCSRAVVHLLACATRRIATRKLSLFYGTHWCRSILEAHWCGFMSLQHKQIRTPSGEKQHKNHPLPLGGSTVLSLSRGPLLFLFFDETQIWLGICGSSWLCVLCVVWCDLICLHLWTFCVLVQM